MKNTLIITGSMKGLLLFICLAVLLENQMVLACTQECALTSSGCTVCFQNCQGTYSFDHCSQATSASSQNNSSSTNYSESECVSRCCSDQLSRYRVQAFQECLSDGSEQKIRLIIIVTISLVILLIVCLCCCIETLREKIAQCFCDRMMKSKVQPTGKETDQSNSNCGKIRETISTTHIKEVSINEKKEVNIDLEKDGHIIFT